MKMETAPNAAAAMFAKTPKGFEEMTRRTYRLPARMRTLLIMIDGKTPTAELLARAGGDEARGLLDTLLADGFVTLLGAPVAPAADPPAVAAPAMAAAAKPAPPASSAAALAAAKQRVSHFLVAVMGPDADFFTGPVDKAANAEELRAIVEKYREAVRAAAGGRKAEEFRTLGEALR